VHKGQDEIAMISGIIEMNHAQKPRMPDFLHNGVFNCNLSGRFFIIRDSNFFDNVDASIVNAFKDLTVIQKQN
jgi:hypothetical protein